MPLPRKKDEGTAAPILNILQAHVKLYDVEEYTEPYTVTRKSDGAQFELDPGFTCTVEIVDDGEDGESTGEKFFESFKYKKNSQRVACELILVQTTDHESVLEGSQAQSAGRRRSRYGP